MLKQVSLLITILLIVTANADASLFLTIDGELAPPVLAIQPYQEHILGVVSNTDYALAYIDFIGDFIIGPPNYGDIIIIGPYDNGGAIEFVINPPSTPGGAPGILMTVPFQWKGGPAEIQLWDDELGYESPAQAISIIPEPATVLLLALGGILLKRSKH